MTYRERRLRKAERLREWAEKREAKAAPVYAEREHYSGDTAFWTQPGDIPQRTRLFRRMDQAHADTSKAHEMDSRAAGIESAADNAIYSDDPDAIEQLEERIAGLEAERDRVKVINKAARAGKLGEIELTTREKRHLMSIAQHQPYYDPAHKGYPPYLLTNLGGNINRQKKRLEALRNPRPRAPRVISLRYAGACSKCDRDLARGDTAHYDKQESAVWCYPECGAASA